MMVEMRAVRAVVLAGWGVGACSFPGNPQGPVDGAAVADADPLAPDADRTTDAAGADAAVDAPSACPPAYAPSGFVTCYRTELVGAAWRSAEADCENDGAHLVVVGSQAEDLALPDQYWIGYSETVVQGTFLWVTGPGASTYTNWASLEPDLLAGAYCTTTRPDNWHDDNCGEAKPYICEHDGIPADPTSWQ
jgi:hypothetical protein